MREEEFLQIMGEQLRSQKVRNLVENEIRSHIDDQKDAYIRQGMDMQQAEIAAVKDMGDPVETGVELDRIHRPRMAWKLVAMIVCISLAGIGIQILLRERFDISSFMPVTGMGILLTGIGLLCMIGVCMVDYTVIAAYAKPLYILLLVGTLGITLGSGNYISLSASFWRQLLLLAVPLYGAILYANRGGYRNLFGSFLWMLPAIVTYMLTLNAALMLIGGLSMMFVLMLAVWMGWYTVSKKKMLAVFGIVTILAPVMAGGYIWFLGAGYYRERLRFWLHPFQTESDWGSQLLSLMSGNRLIGENIQLRGGGMDNWLIGGNDYSLTFLCAGYGILLTIVVAASIAFLFVKGIQVCAGQKNQLGKMMGVASGMTLLIQVIYYILCNFCIMVSATYCPFLTYGAGNIVTYILLGIILSVYRHQDIVDDTVRRRITIRIETGKE